MSEAALRVLQLGQESTYGTSVAATTIFPCEPGSGEFELNRSAESPDEDYGMIVRHQPSRGQWGVRQATGSINSMWRFEDGGQILKSAFGPAVITGAGPYTYTYTPAVTSDTAVSQTIEVNDDSTGQDWDVVSALCTNFSIGFDALTVPGNYPWTLTSEWNAIDKEKSTATAALAAPAINETMEGQWTQLFEGSTATAFGSLAELSGHLIQFRFTGDTPHPQRIYGSASGDKATTRGVNKRGLTFEMGVKISASSTSNIFDIFNVSGGLPTDRRMRIKVTGSGTKTFTIDGRVRYQTVNVEPDMRDGERGYQVTGVYMYDSTLASDIQMVIAGIANATLP